MTQNFPNLNKETDIQVEEAQSLKEDELKETYYSQTSKKMKNFENKRSKSSHTSDPQ